MFEDQINRIYLLIQIMNFGIIGVKIAGALLTALVKSQPWVSTFDTDFPISNQIISE